MILAAGLGTRLAPITDTIPKALVEVGGVPMLERIARRLVAAGADRLIVNVHHHVDRIETFLENADLGVEVAISREPERPLGTGGGVKAARALFRRDRPFFLHNVDILTDADLDSMYADHVGSDASASLAVGRRETSRFLLFDEIGLYGWSNTGTGDSVTAREPAGQTDRWPFAGIHVVDSELLDLLTEEGTFSILAAYLRLSAAGHRIVAWDIGGSEWMEIGNLERLERARRAVAEGAIG
ncbi:MAG: NTP transferase domain-containing protein [Gemmatimonadetes bacterium]|nr:NTP transferase domain-containing protein [Gemmatimonadota bacterium]